MKKKVVTFFLFSFIVFSCPAQSAPSNADLIKLYGHLYVISDTTIEIPGIKAAPMNIVPMKINDTEMVTISISENGKQRMLLLSNMGDDVFPKFEGLDKKYSPPT